MPTSFATTSKATTRQDLAGPDRLVGTISGDGNAGGTTAPDSAFSTRQVDFFRGKYKLLTSGTYSGQWRQVTNFAAGTGTYTVERAFGGQVLSGVTYEIYTLRPDLYTLAVNYAIPKAYPAIYRLVDGFIASRTSAQFYNMPRNMTRINRLSVGGYLVDEDHFDRANSTTLPGGDWIATTGTWGISSEQLYSVTDADADLLTQDADMQDGYIQVVVRGTLNSATAYRSPAICFRIHEDRSGAIDTQNYLLVRLLNATVQLRKVDGGTESSLTTATQTTTDGTDYVVGILFEGSRLRVWVDDVELISYELTGLNLKYVNYPSSTGVVQPHIGIRWDKAGSPGTAARADNFYAYRMKGMYPWPDWDLQPGLQTFQVGRRGGSHPSTSALMRLEGGAPLTLLGADTTFGTLATDSTSVLEISTTDDAWTLFREYCLAELYKLAADPSWNGNLETIPIYRQMALDAEARVHRMLGRYSMPRPVAPIKYPV